MDVTARQVDVVVAVVTYNSEGQLADLLASLDRGLAGLTWHLVVADNASADGSMALVHALCPDAMVVQMGRNAGYAAGINAAVAASPEHRAVLVLNPDVRLASGCVKTLFDALGTPGTGIAVPRLLDRRGELIPSMRREPSILRAAGDALVGAARAGRTARFGEVVTDPARYASEAFTDWAEGSTQLISAACWRAVGPWDESFFLYSEETDFGLRARDVGFRTLFVPTAVATHLEGGSAVSPDLWRLVVLNRVRLYRRRHGWLSASVFWSVVLTREALRAALGRAPNRAAARALLSPRMLREPPGPHLIGRARTTH